MSLFSISTFEHVTIYNYLFCTWWT